MEVKDKGRNMAQGHFAADAIKVRHALFSQYHLHHISLSLSFLTEKTRAD